MRINRVLLQRFRITHEDCIFATKTEIKQPQNITSFGGTKGYQLKDLAHINKILKGFRTGELTIFSGLTGIGKTTFLSQYSLDLCRTNNVRTVWLSLEVHYKVILLKMIAQFARNKMPKDNCDYGTELAKLPLAMARTRGRITFDYLKNFMDIIFANDNKSGFPLECLKPEHFIIDNLRFINTGNGIDRYGLHQTEVVEYLRDKCTEHNCHITLVAHPRKLNPISSIINIGDLFGGGTLSQEADNIIILQSINQNNHAVKYLEILKNRYDGTNGRLYLEFDKDTLRYSVKSCEIV